MIDWTPLLLADPSANLRYLILTNLFGKSKEDEEVKQTDYVRLTDSLVKPLFDSQKSDGSWSPGVLHESEHRTTFQITCDVLKRLGYLEYNITNEAIKKATEYIYKFQTEEGYWTGAKNEYDGYYTSDDDYIPLHTALPLRSLLISGCCNDKRTKKAINWLLERQLPDGAWSTGQTGGGVIRYRAGYRKLPLSKFGCRSNTTGVLSCLAYHPKLRNSEEAKKAMGHLLTCQAFDRQTLGFDVSRTAGFEKTGGTLTYYAKLDHLVTLDLSWRIGVSSDDSRLSNIIEFVKKSFNNFGILEYNSQPLASRWITFDALRSMSNLDINTDWTIDDKKIPFQRYPPIKKRY